MEATMHKSADAFDAWICDLDVEASHWNSWAHFDVTGHIHLPSILNDPEFFESRIPYTVDVTLTLDLSEPLTFLSSND